MENGAIYINTIKNIKQHQNRLSGSIAVYIMPDCTAHELDAPLDWDILEMIADKGTVSQLRHKGIKLFATDLDGVLTDGGMYYSESGDELKRFNTRDAVGLRLLSEAGIITAVITSEECELNRRRAEKMQVDYLFQRIQDKVLCVRELCQQLKISMEQVAYIGDDLNDMSLLKVVGCGACPADAVESVKNLRGLHILNSLGGKGAVREFAEMVLK
jgi:N-acylneuraminate cytidylyltransferase